MSFFDKIKQKIWSYIYIIFPAVQRNLLRYGIVHWDGTKRNFHIGWLAPHKNLVNLKRHLHSKWGFGNHFIAWVEQDQVMSWRKLVDFQNQYHLVVYNDGEICGHHEFTPEAHPIAHYYQKGEREAKEDFIKFLGDFVVEEKYNSHLVLDPRTPDPDLEVTIFDSFMK